MPTTAPTSPTTHRRSVRAAVLTLLATALLAAGTLVGAPAASAATCPAIVVLTFTDVPASNPFCSEIEAAASDGWASGYADGTFQPTAPVTRQAAAAMLWEAANLNKPFAVLKPCEAAPFPDVPMDHPFCAQIRDAAAAGVLGAYADGGFHPASGLSRQALAALITRFPEGALPMPACVAAPFADVPVGHQFCEEISYLSSLGIVGGYADGSYHPTWPVSRQAFVAVLGRWLDHLGGGCFCAVAE